MSRIQFILAVCLTLALPAASSCLAAQLGIDALLVPGQSYMQFRSSHQPLQAGDQIWFDILIREVLGESAEGAQITLWVAPLGHSGSLVLDATGSEAIAGDPNYWVVGNSVGAAALVFAGNRYQFGDGPNNPPSATLQNGQALARFAFIWDGVTGSYEVSIDTTTQSTFLLQNYVQVAPAWAANPVMLYVPEPMAAVALVLTALVLPRRRRSRIFSPAEHPYRCP